MNLKKILAATTAITLLTLLPTAALALENQKISNPGFTQAEAFTGTADTQLIAAITGIVNALLALAALVAAIFVVIGGVRYITSQGDEDAAAQAKSTILYAAIGLIVIALSAVLVNFIVANIPGSKAPAP